MASTKIRKAINRLKSQTTLTLAILNSTKPNHKPTPESQTLHLLHLSSLSPHHSQSLLSALSRRLSQTRRWQVALKSLVLLHLLPSPLPLSMSSFKHKSWDFSALIRAYASYLDLRLHFSNAPEKNALERTKQLQRLLDGFLACRPIGRARNDRMVAALLSTIVRESWRLYADLCEMLALVFDGFLEMGCDECEEVLDVFANAARQVEELRGFYGWCGEMGVAGFGEFPEVKGISDGVLERMEEFVKERRVVGLQEEVVEGDLIDLGEDVEEVGRVGIVGGDPFVASLSIPPPDYVQMADMKKKEEMMMGEELWH